MSNQEEIKRLCLELWLTCCLGCLHIILKFPGFEFWLCFPANAGKQQVIGQVVGSLQPMLEIQSGFQLLVSIHPSHYCPTVVDTKGVKSEPEDKTSSSVHLSYIHV